MQGSVEAPCVSLILPVHNAASDIEQALREALSTLESLTSRCEIIVVDDGSTDEMAAVAEVFARRDARVRVIRHERQLGYGAALTSGASAARFEWVAAAEWGSSLADLRPMLAMAERHDIICGSRSSGEESVARRFGSWVFNLLTRLLLGIPVHNVHGPLKLYRREALLELLPAAHGNLASVELLHRAGEAGLRIGEVSLSGSSTPARAVNASWRDTVVPLAALFPYWWTRRQYPAAAEAVPRAPLWFYAAMTLVALLSGVQLFAHLDYRLFEPDEGRYAEIGRQMVASGQWTVPILHHDPYLDKPPLFYWLIAASFRCFGPHDWAARLVPAAATWLTILAAGLLGRRIVGHVAALLSALVLALAAGTIVAGRFLVLDALLSLFVALTMLTGFLALRGDRLDWRWWLASGLACGLGVLTKGPIAVVLTLPPLLAHCWLSQRRDLLRWPQWLAHLAITGAMVVPWFIAVAIARPEFVKYFLWDHNIERFLSGLNHPEPFWYYLPILLVAALPWSFLLLPWLHFLVSPRPVVASKRSPVDGFFLLWGGWCLAFFSLSSCKLPPYILPAAPALAMLMGLYLQHGLRDRTLLELFPRLIRWSAVASIALLAGGLVTVMVIAVWLGLQSWTMALLVSCLAVAALLAVVLPGGRLRTPAAGWALCCGLMFMVTYQMGHNLAPYLAERRTPVPVAGTLLGEICDRQNGLVYFGRECGSIPFYLGRTDLVRVDDRYPERLEPAVRDRSRIVLLMRKNGDVATMQRYLPAGMTVTRLGEAGRTGVWLLESPVRSAQRADSDRNQ